MQNFAFPYFSRDIAEFWRRWHISLSTWFRDYLYIPLGGSRGSSLLKMRNIFVIFLVSGFWHGANWTYIFWGGLHALYFLPLMLLNKNRENIGIVAENHMFPSVKDTLAMILTFILTVFAWIFFRAENLMHAFSYIGEIFSSSVFIFPKGSDFIGTTLHPFTILLLISIFVIIEWFGRGGQYAIAQLGIRWKSPLRYAMYYAIIMAIFWFGGNEQQFIYFQF
jgi:D-alanyl-lipoteichoic acid acyltransferase DltB (MBOAT superfamily)